MNKIKLSEEPRDLAEEALDTWALWMKKEKGYYPLILHKECYVFFGEWVEIVEANVFDKIENAEVVVRQRFGETQQVEFSNLSWKYGRRNAQRIQNGEIIQK